MRLKSFATALGAAMLSLMVTGGVMPALAYERVPYTNVAIEAVRTSNTPYIIFVHADWCSTCQAQDRILETLIDDPRFANLTIVEVDFDRQQHIMRILNIPDRSTLVSYVGTQERNRSVWETRPEMLEAFLVETMALQ